MSEIDTAVHEQFNDVVAMAIEEGLLLFVNSSFDEFENFDSDWHMHLSAYLTDDDFKVPMLFSLSADLNAMVLNLTVSIFEEFELTTDFNFGRLDSMVDALDIDALFKQAIGYFEENNFNFERGTVRKVFTEKATYTAPTRIREYADPSLYPEEQASYERTHYASVQLGNLLATMPYGVAVKASKGGYWYYLHDGDLLCTMGGSPLAYPEDIEGVDCEEIDQGTLDIETALANKEFVSFNPFDGMFTDY